MSLVLHNLIRTSVLLAMATAMGGGASGIELAKVPVFTSGTEGYNIYRIPTIVQAANGDLLAFAEARAGGDASAIDIVMKRSIDAGATWGTLQLVKDNDEFTGYYPASTPITVGNQSPVVDRLDPVHPGRIWMPFTLENDRVFVTYSDDHGATWSPHVEITSTAKLPEWGWYATGPVHGIQLERGEHAGRLIIPSDHNAGGRNGAHVLYSDDHGQTWQIGAIETAQSGWKTSPNENVAVELVDGRVYFNARDSNSANSGNRSITHSSDGGQTYEALFQHETSIETPVVQNSAIRFRAVDQGDDQNILIYSSPGKWGAREDMTILASLDEGVTWTRKTLIHSGPSAYSDLVKLNNDQFGVLFEAGDKLYDEILFATINYDDLNGPAWNGIHGDVDQNGFLDLRDLDAFVTAWSGSIIDTSGTLAQYQSGDLNLNGKHDILDIAIMRGAIRSIHGDPAVLNKLVVAIPEPTSAVQVMLLTSIPSIALIHRRATGRRTTFD